MPCAGCIKVRKAISQAWHRLRGQSLMLNGNRRPPARSTTEVKSRKAQVSSGLQRRAQEHHDHYEGG